MYQIRQPDGEEEEDDLMGGGWINLDDNNEDNIDKGEVLGK